MLKQIAVSGIGIDDSRPLSEAIEEPVLLLRYGVVVAQISGILAAVELIGAYHASILRCQIWALAVCGRLNVREGGK